MAETSLVQATSSEATTSLLTLTFSKMIKTTMIVQTLRYVTRLYQKPDLLMRCGTTRLTCLRRWPLMQNAIK